ncbi:hypothetical protein CN639_31450 [Bacillus toyonensis]|nr:hypothetical protein CN639_31450 [Bacillus toyonensis]PGB05403.1 hypothetical protein COL96_28265 [Bacillus toyonensis]PHA67049.1 hypothetical protein COE72_30840 [Bacillus toyonensis]
MPVAPVGPVAPVAPVAPVGPVGPDCSNASNDISSTTTLGLPICPDLKIDKRARVAVGGAKEVV